MFKALERLNALKMPVGVCALVVMDIAVVAMVTIAIILI
jgi:hypothetical protein